MNAYRYFPRVVGKTGGKDFLFVHPSAGPVAVGANIIRGGFEYQGQKCSAVSRDCFPESLGETVLEYLDREIPGLPLDPTDDMGNFMGALIDGVAFKKVTDYIEEPRSDPAHHHILYGGNWKDSVGWFVEPTIISTIDPRSRLMTEEIFGPAVTIYIYRDHDWAERALRFVAGNFYINDKPTGAVVGRQPFGGSRHSGTKDKAG